MERYSVATWAPSPSFNRGRSEPIDLIVIHITDGQPSAERCVARFQRPETRASAHFVVGRAGEVYQLVELDDRAWHDSGRNGRSVGIEHIARTPGELSHDDPGMPLTEAQLQASARLVAGLCQELNIPIDRDHIVPHCSNPKSTHRDCGKDIADGGIWPWDRYLDMVEAAAQLTIRG